MVYAALVLDVRRRRGPSVVFSASFGSGEINIDTDGAVSRNAVVGAANVSTHANKSAATSTASAATTTTTTTTTTTATKLFSSSAPPLPPASSSSSSSTFSSSAIRIARKACYKRVAERLDSEHAFQLTSSDGDGLSEQSVASGCFRLQSGTPFVGPKKVVWKSVGQ